MSVNDRTTGHDLLFRYLVGALPAREAERLDELSVTDDEFVARLRAAEDDLIDAYVRGELSGDLLERFKAVYVSQPDGLERIAFAGTLLRYQQRAAAAQPAGISIARWLTLPRLVPQWSLAAAVVVLAAAGYLFLEHQRLRTQLAAEREALYTREQQLQKELTDQRTLNAEAATELTAARESLALANRGAGDRRAVFSFVLLAPTRGAGEIARLVIPPGVDAVALQVQLEAIDFPAYQAALKDPATDRVLWRSNRLSAPAPGARSFLSITIPAALLKQQTYALDLSGVPSRGNADVVARYAFAVVVK